MASPTTAQLADPTFIASVLDFVTPDPGAAYTTVGGVQVPMSGTVSIAGISFPYNLNPTYSPVYQSYLAGAVNSSAEAGFFGNNTVQQYIGFLIVAVAAGFAISYQQGQKHAGA